MYSLLEYSKNKNVINSKYFKYNTSITGSTYNVATPVAAAGDYDANKEGTIKLKLLCH